MTIIIDRRLIGSANTKVNREKFFNKSRHILKKAAKEFVSTNSIKSITNAKKQVKIRTNDLDDYVFTTPSSPDIILPKNKMFNVGSKIPMRKGGEGKTGSGNGPDEHGQEVVFELNKDEFLDLLFDGWELPNWDKSKKSAEIVETLKFGGFTNNGLPSNLDIKRSFKNAFGRSIATKVMLEKKLTELIENNGSDIEIDEIKKQLKTIPFLDDVDLRFRYKVKQEEKTTTAVLFFVMDVSGSIVEEQKQLFKYFSFLFYLFVEKNYKTVKLHFIIHTMNAYQVSERDFFTTEISGGTLIAPALQQVFRSIALLYNCNTYNLYVIYGGDFDSLVSELYDVRIEIDRLAMICQAIFLLYLEVPITFQTSLSSAAVAYEIDKLVNISGYKNIFCNYLNSEQQCLRALKRFVTHE